MNPSGLIERVAMPRHRGDRLRGLLTWEFWPAWLFYLPLLPCWLLMTLRAGHPLFFTRANPAIPGGGLFGESKRQIMSLFPPGLFPPTALLPAGIRDQETVRSLLDHQGLRYPLMAKPDVGERGRLVKPCPDEATLHQHLLAHPETDFLLQAYVDLPLELSVFYYRMPGEIRGAITSLCAKKFLAVQGDGRQSVGSLLAMEFRGRRQLGRLQQDHPELLARVPAAGETLQVEPVGNHCRGTVFLDWNHLVSPKLIALFDEISHQTEGLWYGRFDLRCSSLKDLERGESFSVLEYNGVSAEPAHIYQPGRSLGKAYANVLAHWSVLLRISRSQADRGVPAGSLASLRECWQRWRKP
jgi:hypothetical protein